MRSPYRQYYNKLMYVNTWSISIRICSYTGKELKKMKASCKIKFEKRPNRSGKRKRCTGPPFSSILFSLFICILMLKRRRWICARHACVLCILFFKAYSIHAFARVPCVHVVKTNRVWGTQRILRIGREGVEGIQGVIFGMIIALRRTVSCDDEVKIGLTKQAWREVNMWNVKNFLMLETEQRDVRGKWPLLPKARREGRH